MHNKLFAPLFWYFYETFAFFKARISKHTIIQNVNFVFIEERKSQGIGMTKGVIKCY